MVVRACVHGGEGRVWVCVCVCVRAQWLGKSVCVCLWVREIERKREG